MKLGKQMQTSSKQGLALDATESFTLENLPIV